MSAAEHYNLMLSQRLMLMRPCIRWKETVRWMTWLKMPMKDATSCDMPRRAARRL